MLHARDCAYFLFKRCTCDAGEGHETDAQGDAVPLQIVSSDVISLNKMYRDLMELVALMEAAHAAEVARLRTHLSTVLGNLPHNFRGTTYWEDNDGYFREHPWYTQAVAALAAPTTAAVEAARAGDGDDYDLCRCGPQAVAPYLVFCSTCKRVTPEARAAARAGGGR